jgi:hypothetical protein
MEGLFSMTQVIVFALNLIIFILFAIFMFVPKIFNGKKSILTAYICEGIAALLLILDITKITDTGGYRFLALWIAVFGAVVIACMKLGKNYSGKHCAFFRFAGRAFTVCMALELFVFNFNSTHLFLNNYKNTILDLSSATATNFDCELRQNENSGYTSLEFKGVNTPIGTVTFEAESDKKGYVDFSIDMTDETNSAYYRSGIASAQVLRDNERSQTAVCNFSGTVYDIKFSFTADEDETITLNRIILNNPVTLDFSFLRFGIFFIGSLLIYLLALSHFFSVSFENRRRTVKVCAYTLTGIFIAAALVMTNCSRYTNENHSIISDFKSTSGNQITQEIVDAFEAGQLTLDLEMNEQLAELENPYDTSQREAAQIGTYPWDHLYYDGNYYSYYGIGPVLVLFLPYHLLTGYYFPSSWAIWLFGALGIFFLTKFYLCFMEKFFKKTRASLILSGLFIMQLSTGIWFCFNAFNFYEIAQSSGFVCVTAGAFFLISSNVIGDGKIKNLRLALSAVMLSLGVLCRPTLAVYCVAALLFIYAGLRKKKSLYTAQSGSKAKYYIPYILCALLPFAAIGSIQVWYNYARFGNPLDFGIQYSLTINDFTSAEYHTMFVAVGFFNYLLMFPSFSERFPFFNTSFVPTFYPQGYYFVATVSAVGLLWKCLPIVSYGKSLRAYRLCENKNKLLYAVLLAAVCIICPFAVIFSIWESGYGARYCVDFAWQIIIGALIIAFIVYEKCRDNTQRHLNKLMVLSAVICLVLNLAQTYNWIGVQTYLSPEWQSDALSFARLFEFWR